MRHIALMIFLGIILILGGCGTAGKNFDESKISKIANGTTTRAELRKMFGEPFKTGIQNGQPVWVYEYNSYDPVNNDKSKDLIIIFGPNGVVQSHQFMSSEPAPVN
ncbi:MAG: outer membrane protein assembly factor BamE [Nitrospinaceae bacterium]|nr:outer membrane protein assembly factor BamE [Nitrospinaceae bacterium]